MNYKGEDLKSSLQQHTSEYAGKADDSPSQGKADAAHMSVPKISSNLSDILDLQATNQWKEQDLCEASLLSKWTKNKEKEEPAQRSSEHVWGNPCAGVTLRLVNEWVPRVSLTPHSPLGALPGGSWYAPGPVTRKCFPASTRGKWLSPRHCLYCGIHSPIYKPLWAISGAVDKPENITEAAPLHLWFMFLAKYKTPKALHINILEWSTWKYLMDWENKSPWPATHTCPFVSNLSFPAAERNLGTTAGVSVSLHALFVREPGAKPSRLWPSTDETVASRVARRTICPPPHIPHYSPSDPSTDHARVLQGLYILSLLCPGMTPAYLSSCCSDCGQCKLPLSEQ